MARNTCELNVGRLLEIRVAAGYGTVNDVDQMIRMMQARVATLPPEVRHITVADWRRCKVMSAAPAARAIEMLRRANPRTERSTILYSEKSPTAVMQYLRLVQEAENDARRIFRDADELLAWVAEVLSPEELTRAKEFLGSAADARANG